VRFQKEKQSKKNYTELEQGLKLRLAQNLAKSEFHPALFVLMIVFNLITAVCTININILLKPRAFNLEFQHLIAIFNKISLLCR
jgi:hypothetical protein